MIFTFTQLYNYLSEKAVAWENHRFEKDQERALVLKTILFEFFIAYINLFYYGFVERDFELLSTNFITTCLAKNLLFNMTTHLLPWILFKLRKFMITRKWRRHRSSIKKMIFKELGINPKSFEGMSPEEAFASLDSKTQKKLLENEKEILLQEQTLYTLAMSRLPKMRLVWTNYTIQLGYVAFFSMAFPLAPLFGYLMNVFDLHFSYFSLTNHLRRKPAVEKNGIGIWNNIFEMMSYISLLVNLGLLAVSDEGIHALFLKLFPEYFEKNYTTLTLVIILIVAEHIIFLVKYLIDVGISDKPQWVVDEIEQRKNLAYLDEEKIKRKYNKIKHQSKFIKNNTRVRKSLFSKINELKFNIERKKTVTDS
jgi:anoctamin-8